jgi:hypothetical protein
MSKCEIELSHFMHQKSRVSIILLAILKKYSAKMYRHLSRIRQNSAEISERLQSCTALYSHNQNATLISKIFHPILRLNDFGFNPFAEFKLQLKF